MYKIKSKRVTLVNFSFSFDKETIGYATCSYEYNSLREGFRNLLIIDLSIRKFPPLVRDLYEKRIEDEIINSEDSSQSLAMIKKEIFPDYMGIQIETLTTTFDIELQKDTIIKTKLTRFESPEVKYEITNVETDKSYTTTSENEEDIINIAYENFF